MTVEHLGGVLPLVVAHLGRLHAYEQLLVLLVAFGPFVVLGIVVVVMRRRDLAADDAERDGQADPPASQESPT